MTDDAERAGSAVDAPESAVPKLRMTGIRKQFGPVVALDGVDFEVAPREVHGLLGGNGAGKTTLMNVLYGLYRPDAGTVELDGRTQSIRAPRDAIAAGVGMVHQSYLQVDTYTVAENIVLGTPQPTWPTLNLHEAEQRIADLSERFGLVVDPRAVVEELSVGIRQRVEILKALYRGAGLLVLDEPTTSLTPQEVDILFGSLRSIVDDGMSVIFITHKIRETMAVCDRMTVMRDGRRVATVERADTTAAGLAGLMVGDEAPVDGVAEVVGQSPSLAAAQSASTAVQELSAPAATAAARVVVRDLAATNEHGVEALHGCSLSIGRGEVVGIAGVAGNGQVELAEVLAGVRGSVHGSVTLDDSELVGRRTAGWIRAGVAYVPEDRHRDGLLPTLSIAENLLLGAQGGSGGRRRWLLDWRAVRAAATEAIATYSIRAPGPTTLAGTLSGGNIQRVLLARAFSHEPRFLILHNPVRGLDIPSTQFVHDRIREAARDGTAVLLLSEDIDEIAQLSDRVLVFFGGRIVGERRRGNLDLYELGRLMTGVGVDEAVEQVQEMR